jgi:hypothetical protein
MIADNTQNVKYIKSRLAGYRAENEDASREGGVAGVD